MTKFALIIGTRPNFMKAVPIWNSLKKRIPKEQLYFIHTGQHYSHNLSKVFIDDLKLNNKEIIYLEKYSDTQYPKTSVADGFSWIIKHLSTLFINEKIDKVIVFGDVNSTLAAGLAAKINKLHLIHIESGLRSYDSLMPEERNRLLVDKLSDQLFITEKSAKQNLFKEGITKNIYHCGNTMMDTLNKYLPNIRKSTYYSSFYVNTSQYILFTLHRQNNVDNKSTLEKIIKAILNVTNIIKTSVLFIAHPRTVKNIKNFKLDLGTISLINSQSYLNMLNLIYNAGILLTDSGGLQEESSYLGIPCITIRKNTERPLTVEKGYNCIISPERSDFYKAFEKEVLEKYGKRKENLDEIRQEMGNGEAAAKIVNHILQ
jgi:UDP-N-acetylglucosamine 2-epimerase (non-hydrolysing)